MGQLVWPADQHRRYCCLWRRFHPELAHAQETNRTRVGRIAGTRDDGSIVRNLVHRIADVPDQELLLVLHLDSLVRHLDHADADSEISNSKGGCRQERESCFRHSDEISYYWNPDRAFLLWCAGSRPGLHAIHSDAAS